MLRTAAAIIAGVVALAAAPASAGAEANDLSVFVHGQPVQRSLDHEEIALSCAAFVQGTVHVDACYLLGADGSRYDIPVHTPSSAGADAEAGVFTELVNQPYTPCVEASGIHGYGDPEHDYPVVSTHCGQMLLPE